MTRGPEGSAGVGVFPSPDVPVFTHADVAVRPRFVLEVAEALRGGLLRLSIESVRLDGAAGKGVTGAGGAADGDGSSPDRLSNNSSAETRKASAKI